MKKNMSSYLRLITNENKSALKVTLPVQQPDFDHLEVFSPNAKVNNVVRALVALYGKENIVKSVQQWLTFEEPDTLTLAEQDSLYESVENIVRNPERVISKYNN